MKEPSSTRRSFVKSSAVATAFAAAAPSIMGRAYAGGGGTIRVGIVGCGGRGTAAVVNALSADPDVKLCAMGDLFESQVNHSYNNLASHPDAQGKMDVPPERRFVGFDAYRHVIDQVDLVLLTTTPHYRPLHLKYAVDKGIPSFNEKPVATDPVMLRDIYATCRKAQEKGVSVVSGLCYRYEHAKRETMRRIFDGQIGEIVSAETNFLTNSLWHRGNKPEWTPMHYQHMNWYYYTWLSGDFIVEQHVHSLDKIAWAFGDAYPVKATAIGGRLQRSDPMYGHIYDHFSTVFEFENGRRAYSLCRQMSEASSDVSDYVFGTQGTAEIQKHRVRDRRGRIVWDHRKDGEHQGRDNMYQNELNEMLAAIRSGNPIHNGDYMCKSTLMAIMARESAYSGQTVTWDDIWNSPLSLAPPKYDWGPAPQAEVAIPGRYKLPKAATA